MLSKHELDLFDISGLSYQNSLNDTYIPDSRQITNKALRCHVFSKDLFYKKYVKLPEFDLRKPAHKMEFEQISSDAKVKNQIILKPDVYEGVLTMGDAVKNHHRANLITCSGVTGKEDVFTVEDVEVLLKPHFIADKSVIVNLTGTSDISAQNFQNECINFKWYKKAALFNDFYKIPVCFVVVQNKSPYDVAIRVLDQRAIDFGREEYLKNISTYKACIKSGVWSGVSDAIEVINLPEWAYNK